VVGWAWPGSMRSPFDVGVNSYGLCLVRSAPRCIYAGQHSAQLVRPFNTRELQGQPCRLSPSVYLRCRGETPPGPTRTAPVILDHLVSLPSGGTDGASPVRPESCEMFWVTMSISSPGL
jgi:hypothetical protein